MQTATAHKPANEINSKGESDGSLKNSSIRSSERGADAGLPQYLKSNLAAPSIPPSPEQAGLTGAVKGPAPIQLKCTRCKSEIDQQNRQDSLLQRQAIEGHESEAEEEEQLLQPKLSIGEPDDEYEKEADQIADRVMRMPAAGGHDHLAEDGPCIQTKPRPIRSIQRLCAECEEELADDSTPSIQAKSSGRASSSIDTLTVKNTIERAGGGSPLSETMRSRVEPVLGSDLSGVQVHSDGSAQSASKALNARAFTNRNHVFLGEGESSSDVLLMAHELTHVVQQGATPGTEIQRLQPDVAPSDSPDQPGSSSQNDADDARAETAAREVYDALNWLNEVPRAMEALSGHGEDMRAAINREFQRLYHGSLRAYIKSQLGDDDLVRGYALLHARNYFGQHVSMGLALIPLQTRDDEVFRLLYGTNTSGRQALEQNYNNTFGLAGNAEEYIGEGSLKDDLIDDLSGWREQKSLALLNRDLTEADKLYFDSTGISGTHEEPVIERLQRLWDSGPQALIQLEHDWNQYIKNEANWTDEGQWSDQDVRDAMDSELSGESWRLVKAILDGLARYKAGTGVETGPLTEEEDQLLEENRLQVAEDTLSAAATGAGTNEEQMYRAVRQIREIYTQRIERARTQGDETALVAAQTAWETRRQQLVSTDIVEEMDEGTVDYIHTRLLLRGNLTTADELYLADRDFDDARITQLVTKAWAQGKIDELHSDAGRAVFDGDTELRPAFEPNFLIPITRGHEASQVILLLRRDYSNARRGSERLRLEIENTSSASALDQIKSFLSIPGLSSELRNAVIAGYVGDHVGGEGSSVERFITHLRNRYGEEPVLYDIQDIVDPVTTAAQAFGRAADRYETANSGVLNSVLNDIVEDYDQLTGEDTQAVTQESLERLRYLSEQTDASTPEIQAMMGMAGVTSLNDLAATEYSLFRQRLDELRSIKLAITEAIATAVQLAIETVATIVTGGAAGPMLIASLGATLAAIAVREALLGDEYRTMSEENARAIAMVFASHGAGAFGRNLFAVSPERLRELSRIQVFLLEGAQNAVAQVGVQTVSAALENRAPTPEAILASAISIMGSSVGSGLQGSLAHDLGSEIGSARRLRELLIANMAGSVVTANSEAASNMVRSGVDSFDGPGIALNFLRASGQGIVNGVGGAAGQFGAEVRSAPSGGGEDVEGRREQELEDGQHDSRRLPAEGDVDVTRSTSDEPGVLAVVPVNDAHSVSVVRDADGNLAVTICSPFCSHLRLLLSALREDVGSSADTAQVQIARGLERTQQIERRLRDNPLDPEAHAALRALSRNVEWLLRTYGDERIFGTIEQPAPRPGIVIPGGEVQADIEHRRSRHVQDGRFVVDTDADRVWLFNNPPSRPNNLAADHEGLWQAYQDYYQRRLQSGSDERPPRTWESYRDERMGHLQRGSEFEGRVSIEAEDLNAEADFIVASQANVSESENPTNAAGQLTRPDQLMIDPSDSTGMAVSNKSRAFDDPAAARSQVISDVNELLRKYSGPRFVRRRELARQVGNDEGRIDVTEVVLVYDAGAMGVRQPDETDQQFGARMRELARDISSTASRHAHELAPDIVFWVTFHDYSGNSPLPTSNDATARVAEEE